MPKIALVKSESINSFVSSIIEGLQRLDDVETTEMLDIIEKLGELDTDIWDLIEFLEET